MIKTLSFLFLIAISAELFCQLENQFHWFPHNNRNFNPVVDLNIEKLDPELQKLISEYKKFDSQQSGDKFEYFYKNDLGPQSSRESFEKIGNIEIHKKILLPSEKELFNIRYERDQNGHRVTPGTPKHAVENLFLLGASDEFGIGMEESQTVPAYLQAQLKNFRVYNFGVGGIGPSDYLSEIDNESPFFKGIELRGGIAVYIFRFAKFRRSIFNCENPFRSAYILDDQDKLRNVGSFSSLFSTKYIAYRFLCKSKFVSFFNLDFLLYSSREKQNFVAIMARLQNEIEKRFGVKNFLFVYAEDSEKMKWLLESMSNLNWRVMSISNSTIHTITEGKNRIPYDGHPSYRHNWIVSYSIINELKKNGWIHKK